MSAVRDALERHLRPHLGATPSPVAGDAVRALVDRANAVTAPPERLQLPTVHYRDAGAHPARDREAMRDRLAAGRVAVQFVLGGDARRLGRGYMYSQNLFALAREHGFEWPGDGWADEPSIGHWQLQTLARRAEELAGPEARRNLAVVYQLGNAMESHVLEDLVRHDFFGLDRERSLFITDPAPMPGFVLDANGRLGPAPGSAPRSYNHGYSTMLLARPGAAFTVSARGRKETLPGTAIDWLHARGVHLLVANRVNDLTRLTDRAIHVGLLDLSWRLMGEHGANIVFEVVDNPTTQSGGWAVRNVEENPAGFGQIVDDHLNMATAALRERLRGLREEARERSGRDLPYNAYRLIFRVDALAGVLEDGLPMVAQQVDGAVYPSFGTSDITRTRTARAIAVGDAGESLHDFKRLADLRHSLDYLAAEARAGRVPLTRGGGAVGRVLPDVEAVPDRAAGGGHLRGAVVPLDRAGLPTAERLAFEAPYRAPTDGELRLLRGYRETIAWGLEGSVRRDGLPPAHARLLRSFRDYLREFDLANVFILHGAPARNPANGRPLLCGYATRDRLYLHERFLGTPGWLLHELLETWALTDDAVARERAGDGRLLVEVPAGDGGAVRLTPHKLIRGFGYRAAERHAPVTGEDEALCRLGDGQGRGLQGWIALPRIRVDDRTVALAPGTEWWTDGAGLAASKTFAGRSVVLVEPHPDDGMIGAGALFKALVDNGVEALAFVSVVSDPEGVLDEYVYARNHDVARSDIDAGAVSEFRRGFSPGEWRTLKRAVRMGEAEDAAKVIAESLGWTRDFVDLEIDLPLEDVVCFPDGRLDSRFSRFRSPSGSDMQRIRDLVSQKTAAGGAAQTTFLLPSPFDRHQHHQDVARMFLRAIAAVAPAATVAFYEPLRGFEEQNLEPGVVYGFGEDTQEWYETVVQRAYRSQTWRHGYVNEIRRLAGRRAVVEAQRRGASVGAYAQRLVVGTIVEP